MDSPKYSEQARIYKAQQYARQPWKPFKVVFIPSQEDCPANEQEAERLKAALISADIELSRIIHKVKLED